MRKKLLSGLLCLSMCFSILPAALAEGEDEGYPYPRQVRDPETKRWGLSSFVDGEEIILLPKEYDSISNFQDGTAIVQKNTDTYGSTFGLVDYNGSIILPVEYSDLSRGSSDESDNILRACKREENFYRYLRPDGTPLTDYTFTECSDFCRHIGVGCRIIDGKALYGAVNAQGEILIPFEYDALSSPLPSYYRMEWLSAEKDGCCGAFDYNGNLLRRCIYPNNTAVTLSLSLPAQMSEEEEMNALIAASQTWEPYHYDGDIGNGLWGYKPTQYDTELPPYGSIFWAIFASAQPFDETGHAQVTLEDGRVGTIDQSGNFTPAPSNSRFSDVPAGSWYDKAVTTCAEKGVMVGTGEGIFSPNAELTDPECLTLALRLYDLQRGGDGTLEKAPENYGYMTFTLSDGKTFYRYGAYDPFFNCGHFYSTSDDNGFHAVYVQAPGETPEEREAYAKAHEGAATFVAEGKAYTGTVVTDSLYYGPCLRFIFDCPEDERPDLDTLFGHSLPAPDKWYRDAVYTARQWGLDSADGFSVLVNRATYQSSLFWTERQIFARALAVAAGELEKRYEVPRIPDVERAEYNEGIYSLYEAGVLNGQDSFGTFWGDKELTRAECATMVARVLDPAQRLTSPPAAPNGYEQAVIDLRTGFTYLEESEKTYETDHCTVFVYDRGGAPSSPRGNVTLIYKPGSALGDGVRVNCPIPNVLTGVHRDPPEVMALSEDRKTFTYSYYYDDHVHTCVVDLATGQTAESDSPITYENQLAFMTQSVGYTVDERLDGPTATVVARHRTRSYWSRETEQVVPYDDYELYLLAAGQNAAHRLVLPSTELLPYSSAPTTWEPDTMEFSEDYTTLTYTYHFTEQLWNGDTLLHDKGTYVYTVDIPTATLSVELLGIGP